MVETRSNKKPKSLYKQPITIITNETTIKTQYGSTDVGPFGNSKDRLSELPDEVLVHILSFLPIGDAVGTLLLRRFGNLWTFLPTLKFIWCSPRFINNVMKHHKTPTIEKCVIAGERELERVENVRKWVGLALRKKPKMLAIYLEHECFWEVGLPRLFTSQSIVTLKFSNLWMKLPRRVNMGSLKRLKLQSVEMADEDLKALEAGCPCLQEICINWPSGLSKLHFTSPSIERLELEFNVENEDLYSLDCPNLKYLHITEVCLDYLQLIDVSSVTHARINNNFSSITVHNFEVLHQKFQNANFFHLRDQHDVEYIKQIDGHYRFSADKVCMQVEQCGNEKVAFQRNSWALLALKPGLEGSCLIRICRLLRNSRVLEELILYIDVDFSCNFNMLLQELSSPCKMCYLKTVTIRDFEKPCKTLVQLMEFLLRSAVLLDKLIIICNKKEQLFFQKWGLNS